MHKLRIIIADDERPARNFLRAILSQFEDAELIGEAGNGLEALEMIRELKPDIALLDLQMPELSGLEAVKLLKKNELPLVAFVTAYDEFAVQAFELNAVDYLLKPIEKNRLRGTLDRAQDRLEQKDLLEKAKDNLKEAVAVYEQTNKDDLLERIPLKKNDEIFLVSTSEIASIIADGELLHITTANNEKYLINHRLKDLENRLDPERFIRLSRGAIANIEMFEKISPISGGTYQITLKNGQEVSTSRQQSRILRERLLKL